MKFFFKAHKSSSSWSHQLWTKLDCYVVLAHSLYSSRKKSVMPVTCIHMCHSCPSVRWCQWLKRKNNLVGIGWFTLQQCLIPRLCLRTSGRFINYSYFLSLIKSAYQFCTTVISAQLENAYNAAILMQSVRQFNSVGITKSVYCTNLITNKYRYIFQPWQFWKSQKFSNFFHLRGIKKQKISRKLYVYWKKILSILMKIFSMRKNFCVEIFIRSLKKKWISFHFYLSLIIFPSVIVFLSLFSNLSLPRNFSLSYYLLS